MEAGSPEKVFRTLAPCDATTAEAGYDRDGAEGVRDNQFLLPGTVFTLITTQTAPPGSATALLRPNDPSRDPATATAILVAAAKQTKSVQLKPACEAFLKLSGKKRNGMMEEVHVHDDAARIKASKCK